MADEAPRPPGALLLKMFCLIALLHAALVFLTLFWLTALPGDLTFPENSVVLGAWQAAAGAPVYADWHNWPHRFAPYGPALYYPAGWAARLMQGDAQLSFLFYQLGRWISLAALGGLGLIGAGCLRRAGASRLLAAAGGLGLLVVWPGLLQYVVSFRPDAPMVCFAAAAVWIALGGLHTRARCAAALICLWLSAAYKPAAWAAPLIIAALAWRREGRGTALAGAGVYAVGLAAGVLAMQAASGGLFVMNQFSAMTSGIVPPAFLSGLREQGFSAVIAAHAMLLLRWLAGLAGAVWLLLRAKADSAERWIAAWFMLALSVALVQSCKQGADINYLLEAWALSGMVTVLAVLHAWNAAPGFRFGIGVGLLVCVVLPSVVGLCQTGPDLRAARAIKLMQRPLNPLLEVPSGSLLFDTAFTRGDLEAHAIPDALIYHLMVKQGKIDPGILIDKLVARQAPALNLSPVSWFWLVENPPDPRLGAAFKQNYRFDIHGAWHVGTPN